MAGFAMSDFDDVLAAHENAFGDEESAGEFGIVAWGAHGDGNTFAANANFKRFFTREPV